MADASCHGHNVKNVSYCINIVGFIVHMLDMRFAFGNIAVFTVRIPDVRLAVKMVILSKFFFHFLHARVHTKRVV